MAVQVDDGSAANIEVKKTWAGWIIAVDRTSLFYIPENEKFSDIVLLGSRIDAASEMGIDTVIDQSRIEAAAYSFSMLLSRWSISKERLIKLHGNGADEVFDCLLEE